MSNLCQSALFRRCAAADVIRLARGKRIVIIAPHPDDETLGCGLLIAKAARAGLPVAVVALTDGQASHTNSRRWPPKLLGMLRRAELRRAMARLGAGSARYVFMHWRDGEVAQSGQARQLRGSLRALDPGVILAASPCDHHPDHKAGWTLTRQALSATPIPLIAYAVWSRVDSKGPAGRDPSIAAKRWAIAAHRSQSSDYIADDPQGFTLSAGVLKSLVAESERFMFAGNLANARLYRRRLG